MKNILPDYIERVLITGGAGFIGLNTIRKLLKESKAKIFNIDKLGYASDLTGIKEVLLELLKRANLDWDEWNDYMLTFDGGYIEATFDKEGNLRDIRSRAE